MYQLKHERNEHLFLKQLMILYNNKPKPQIYMPLRPNVIEMEINQSQKEKVD